MFAFAALLFLVGSSSAKKLLMSSLGDEEATVLVDLIIGQLKEASPNQFSFSPLMFGINSLQEENAALLTSYNDNISHFGKLTSYPGWVADMKSIHRASPVVSVVSGGNLTLSSSVSFGNLRANWAYSELNILGVSMLGDTSVTFRQNEFVVKMTIYNNPVTGACALDLHRAGFSVLSAVDISIRPIGFFNQIRLDATINHLTQSVFDRFSYIDVSTLQRILETAVCRTLPN